MSQELILPHSVVMYNNTSTALTEAMFLRKSGECNSMANILQQKELVQKLMR